MLIRTVDARTQIEELLRIEIGLEPESIGRSILDRVVRERALANGFSDLQGYAAHLRNSRESVLELIDATVVPETWFFRDLQIFEALAQEIQKFTAGEKSKRTPRLLSLPCSTGEEPYSIAMCLAGCGFESATVMIEGVDVCRRSIALAQRGLYGRNSFRGESLEFRDKYFVAEGSRYQIQDTVRSMVRFRSGNVLASTLADELGLFDFVFCRNVLIYFDLPSRDLAFATLSRLVRIGGLLIVTPAEAPLVAGRGFEAAEGFPISFFRRVQQRAAPKVPLPAIPAAGPAKPIFLSARPFASTVPTDKEPQPAPVPAEAPAKAEEPLDQAARLADEGKLDEAEKVCHEFLSRHGPSAEAYYRLGLVCDAQGRQVEAGALYRKALYLAPAHYEALVHLSAILEVRGEKAEALLMRQRAIRIQGK